jgi:hypothetical protein
MKPINEIKQDLAQFYGTEGYVRIAPNAVLTDGTHYIAEEVGAYWLFQDTALFLSGYQETDTFQVIKLDTKDEGFKLMAGDGNGNWRPLEFGEFTDFPPELMPFEFYASWDGEHWVFMLKGEY